MCPQRRMLPYNIMSRRRSQEAERPQGQLAPSSQRSRRREALRDNDSEMDDEAYQGTDGSLLLYSSVQAYAAVQQSTAVRQLTCEISEVITVESPQCSAMSTTSFMESQRRLSLMYEREDRSSTPELRMEEDSDQPDDDDDDDNQSQGSTESEEIIVMPSLNTTMSIITRDLNTPDLEDEFVQVQAIRNGCKENSHVPNNNPAPKPTIARRRLRPEFKMPAPTASAIQVANRVIKYARCIQNKYENEMCCPTCGLFPIWPVTGPCGHTRCITCTEFMQTCPCGEACPETLHINILIRDIQKTNNSSSVEEAPPCDILKEDENMEDTPRISNPNVSLPSALIQNFYLSRHSKVINLKQKRRLPMSSLARYNQALELLMAGKYKAAAPHIALAAASHAPDTRGARVLLAQCITIMSRNRDPRILTRQLNHLVRDLSSTSWVRPSDMECILCCDTFTNPVTTPCGHMFCRICLERTMDYKKRCPLCLRSLELFKLSDTRDTALVQAALKSINVVNVPTPLEPDLIPIFVCTVAYPSVPCPLFIFDPRYWLMIRRVLESGSRRFGMVACDRGKSYVDYGTILEVRDCVHLEDGRSILSTIGLSRFKVIERGVRDGCEVARILRIADVPVHDLAQMQLRVLANRIMLKALLWIKTLNAQVKEDIEAAFGSLPPFYETIENTADGPAWLWWLVAVLPLRSEIKVLILSTTCLVKRLLAVSRTLEAVDQVALTTASPSECELRNNHARRAELNQQMRMNEVNGQDVS
ncbi:uncharacterized protein LOC113494001 isoform X3 [Trichoplusia ni]|uniref:Uncharacterized protein LOC113494001 isoform X3 n=1 Tax=Trichoplusia ni TaxID=7111 RepID=A0A7E5VHU7_TRINI|nr:uncharacterized protein LOC113494001 isoform X3 [Trichoplusia ni]